MYAECIFAGFGGQGVLTLGRLLAYAAMHDGKKVAWIPSYGPEMRGGTANCAVVIADDEVGSPIPANPGYVVAMNLPSMDKFEPIMKKGGILVYNKSQIPRSPKRDDITAIGIDADYIADELGSNQVAGVIALGVLIGKSGLVPVKTLKESFKEVIPERHHNLIPLNHKAIDKGVEIANGG
jgi:2-oxoglutarate ferredoxin oxidoreductase subunit gamma